MASVLTFWVFGLRQMVQSFQGKSTFATLKVTVPGAWLKRVLLSLLINHRHVLSVTRNILIKVTDSLWKPDAPRWTGIIRTHLQGSRRTCLCRGNSFTSSTRTTSALSTVEIPCPWFPTRLLLDQKHNLLHINAPMMHSNTPHSKTNTFMYAQMASNELAMSTTWALEREMTTASDWNK